jgi:hypothetical protein
MPHREPAMSGREKFEWFEGMNHDEKIPLTWRAVIGYCGIRYAKAPDYLICVTQKTVAENLHTNEKMVSRAFARAELRGWMRRVGERKRGRGHHGGDTWMLTRPVAGNTGQEVPGPDVSYSEKYRTPEAEIPDTVNASTSGNDDPKGFKEGFLKEGFIAQGTAGDLVERAKAIVDDCVDGQNRKGGARKLIDAAVTDALRRGLDENHIVGLIEKWQGRPHPSSYRLCAMLADAVEGLP